MAKANIYADGNRILITAPNGAFPKLFEIPALRVLVAQRINRAAASPAPPNPGGRHEVSNAPTVVDPRPGAALVALGRFQPMPVLGRCPMVQP